MPKSWYTYDPVIHFVNSRYRDAVPVWLGTNYQMMTGSWLRVPAPDLGSLKIIQKMQPPNHQMKYTAHRKSSGLIFGLLVIRSSSWDPHLISRYFWASPGLLFNQRLFWSCFVNILLPNLRQDPPCVWCLSLMRAILDWVGVENVLTLTHGIRFSSQTLFTRDVRNNAASPAQPIVIITEHCHCHDS